MLDFKESGICLQIWFNFLVQQTINSRPGTPNSDTSSVKLPSLAMERIKIHTSNAMDRMEIMQKRYHEYKNSLKNGDANSDSRRASMNASPFEVCLFSLNYNCNFIVTKILSPISLCWSGANLEFILFVLLVQLTPFF